MEFQKTAPDWADMEGQNAFIVNEARISAQSLLKQYPDNAGAIMRGLLLGVADLRHDDVHGTIISWVQEEWDHEGMANAHAQVRVEKTSVKSSK